MAAERPPVAELLRDVARWLGGRAQGMLVALLVLAAGTWLFVELADEVLEGETHRIDERLLMQFRTAGDPANPIGPAWLEETARDITGLGGVAVLTLLTLSAFGFLVLQRKPHMAVYVVSAVAIGVTLSLLLKSGFDRPRPDLVPHGQVVYTSSFPSGHSMMSAVVFLTLGALLASAQADLRLKSYLLGLAVLLTLMVGVSRVYLGVHWPTDVLGGWTAGSAWALATWSFTRYLRRRGTVE